MRKLLWFTMGFALAVGVCAYLLPPNLYFPVSGGCAVLLAACLACMLKCPKVRIIAMLLFGCVAGFVWQAAYDATYLSIARQCDGQTLQLTMTAADQTEITNYGGATECRVELAGKHFQIRVYHEETISLAPGDVLSGQFLLRCTLPGCNSDSSYNRGKGIFLTARSAGELTTQPVKDPQLFTLPARWRIALTDRIDTLFPGDTAGFAKALLLGDTDGIDYETDTAFKLSGIRHVIAVSGLHVSILFSLVYFFAGRRKWLTALIGLPVLLLFAAVAGFSPSITRACIMHSLTVVALLIGKEYDPPSALSFAVLLMLLINPWTVTDVGFQLSVGCLAGIFLFATPIQRWLMEKKRLGRFYGWKRKAADWFSVSVSISLSANVFTTVLSACYFGTVSLVSLLTNLLTLWVITFLFYGILLALAVSAIFVPLGVAVAWIAAWPIRYVLLMAKLLAAFPLSAVYTQSIYTVFWLVFCYVLLAVFLLSKGKYPWLLGGCCAVGLCIALLASWAEPMADDCRMTVLDVGQGQCILLQSEGKNYLVDCGGDSDTAAADKAAALLLSQGIRKLDGLIITHYDADHAAGAVHLLQRVQVDVLFLPNSRDTGQISKALAESGADTVLRVDRDVVVTFGSAKITLIPSQNAETDNESGLCVLFQREECDILITGDRSDRGERELMEHIALPQLDVLVVGHHGSKHSTCRELLIITRPENAIISVGAENVYGHPHDDVLTRLKRFGCALWRTDLHGTIVYRG